MSVVDRMHKWGQKNSFVFVLIRPTSLILKEHFLLCILSMLTGLVSLIGTKTKEYFFWLPFVHSVYWSLFIFFQVNIAFSYSRRGGQDIWY